MVCLQNSNQNCLCINKMEQKQYQITMDSIFFRTPINFMFN